MEFKTKVKIAKVYNKFLNGIIAVCFGVYIGFLFFDWKTAVMLLLLPAFIFFIVSVHMAGEILEKDRSKNER